MRWILTLLLAMSLIACEGDDDDDAGDVDIAVSPVATSPIEPLETVTAVEDIPTVEATQLATEAAAGYGGSPEVGGSPASAESVAPDDGECPDTHPVKGFIGDDDQRFYLEPEDDEYAETEAEECFVSSAAAADAGYGAQQE